ncbi:MAG: efflux RND transporter periplasmic adaptor subunit [Bryobacteraceae bacterium]|nr:efflux RND transporter periplasmic adaptor subunit [Bryobacteraceae bacterium]
MPRNRRLARIGLAAVAALAAAASWFLLRRAPAPAAPKAAGLAQKALPAEVLLSGTIRARHIVQVPAPVEGVLERYMAEPGQEVFEGQLLARIHNEGLVAEQQAAKADLERVEGRIRALESALIAARLEASRSRAEADRVRDDYEKARGVFERQQFLFQEGAVARQVFERAKKDFEAARQQFESAHDMARLAEDRVDSLSKELDAARTRLEEAREALEAADRKLESTEVHSPVDGVLLARNRQPGDPVGPHVPDLLQIAVDLSVLEVVVEPEPPVLERLAVGLPVMVEVAEGPPVALEGRVIAIEKDGRVIVEFANPNPAVRPGMTARVRIPLRRSAP